MALCGTLQLSRPLKQSKVPCPALPSKMLLLPVLQCRAPQLQLLERQP